MSVLSDFLWQETTLSGFQDDRSCEWRINWEKRRVWQKDYAHINGENHFEISKALRESERINRAFNMVSAFLHINGMSLLQLSNPFVDFRPLHTRGEFPNANFMCVNNIFRTNNSSISHFTSTKDFSVWKRRNHFFHTDVDFTSFSQATGTFLTNHNAGCWNVTQKHSTWSNLFQLILHFMIISQFRMDQLPEMLICFIKHGVSTANNSLNCSLNKYVQKQPQYSLTESNKVY